MTTIASDKVTRFRKNLKRKMIVAMGGECQICGYAKCDAALDFHHIDPMIKEMSFGKIRRNPTAISNVLHELKKCILLCSRCHREIHSGCSILPETYAKLDLEVFGKYEKDGEFFDIARVSTQDLNNIDKLTIRDFCKLKGISRKRLEKDSDSLGSVFVHKPRATKFEFIKEDLEMLIKEKPLIEIGRMYGVSDNAIRKRCKKLGIELEHKRGYWAKKLAGKL